MTNTATAPTDQPIQLARLMESFVPNADIATLGDLYVNKLVRRGRDGYVTYTRRGLNALCRAAVDAAAKAPDF